MIAECGFLLVVSETQVGILAPQLNSHICTLGHLIFLSLQFFICKRELIVLSHRMYGLLCLLSRC